MALTREQRRSIVEAGRRLRAKGKLLNLDLRRLARRAGYSPNQPARIGSAPPAKPKTPNGTD